MKKPTKPSEPTAPWKPSEPSEPQKVCIPKHPLRTYDYYEEVTLQDLLELTADAGLKPEDVKLDISERTDPDDYQAKVEVVATAPIKNHNYNSEMKQFERAKKKYEKSLDQYHVKLKAYNVKLEKYNKEYKKYEEELKKYVEFNEKQQLEKLKKKYEGK